MRQTVEEVAGIALICKADGSDEGSKQDGKAEDGVEAAASGQLLPGVDNGNCSGSHMRSRFRFALEAHLLVQSERRLSARILGGFRASRCRIIQRKGAITPIAPILISS